MAIPSALATTRRLLQQLAEARARTDELFRVVHPDAFFDRPIPERHRIIFYVGHVEAFDWNLIWKGTFEREAFHEDFDRLFAFGIDPVDDGLPRDEPVDWPSLAEVRQYCSRVRATLDGCLQHREAPARYRDEFTTGTLLQVAMEHRLMHAETLAYLVHQLPYDRKAPHPQTPVSRVGSVSARVVAIPAGQATLGRTRASGFGWDNEFEEHSVEVPAFAIDAHKVTNGQFLDFVRAGGYEERGVWRPEDWAWKESQGIRHPVFWVPRGDAFEYRAMFEQIPLPHDWPVYVSHAEASAYARWKEKSLPTEAQWQRAAYGTADRSERLPPRGGDELHMRHGNFDFRRWDPVPEGMYAGGHTMFGVDGMVGNGWEWTSTVFHPFPGFEPFAFYPGYSANFFDGAHYVMKGGSARTAACMVRPSFRNWFQPHYQYVYAGFRCVGES